MGSRIRNSTEIHDESHTCEYATSVEDRILLNNALDETVQWDWMRILKIDFDWIRV